MTLINRDVIIILKEDYCKEPRVAFVVNFFFLVSELIGQADVYLI